MSTKYPSCTCDGSYSPECAAHGNGLTIERFAVMYPYSRDEEGTLYGFLGAAQGRCCSDTLEEAEERLKNTRENNGDEIIKQCFNCTKDDLRVMPIRCWSSHGDPIGHYSYLLHTPAGGI